MLDEDDLRAVLRLPGGVEVEGPLLDLSPGGLRILVKEPNVETVLRAARVMHATVRSSKQVIFEVEAAVAHVGAVDSGGVVVGLSAVAEPDERAGPRNLSDRRTYQRIPCDLPGLVLDGSGEAASMLPVVVADISEVGCRLEGIPRNNHPRPGALLEVSIQPPAGSAVSTAARVVAEHGPTACGVRFEGRPTQALSAMVAALRYPDLAVATPGDAPKMWEVLSAAGYLRERERDRYLLLREHAVHCWSRLSAPEAVSLNRAVVSRDEDGSARSITQVTRFYPSAWLGHHLAAAGDRGFRRRVVPQHHGNVHDTVEELNADYFLVYYNAQHKGQTSLYTSLRDRFPEAEMALNDLVCFDVAPQETVASSAAASHRVHQVSNPYSPELVRWLRGIRDEVSFRALGIDQDFGLEGLGQQFAKLGLLRRRVWFVVRDEAGSIAAAASVDVAPPGFNLTSIGNHATLYVSPDGKGGDVTRSRLRALLHYVGDAFRQHDRAHFLLMAPPALELALRSFRLRFMAPGQEFVAGAGLFRTLNTFINEAYHGGERAARARRESDHA